MKNAMRDFFLLLEKRLLTKQKIKKTVNIFLTIVLFETFLVLLLFSYLLGRSQAYDALEEQKQKVRIANERIARLVAQTKETTPNSETYENVIVKKNNTTPIQSERTTPIEWGIAKQLDEVTWTIRIGQDERIATPQELFEALNSYRQIHGRGTLTWDDNLASFARDRAAYFESIKNLDKHEGFKEYLKNEENFKKLGFRAVGENAAYGNRLLGVHMIEWVFAADQPHNDNQLDPSWTHVGIGIEGLGVDLIFGKSKL